MNWTVLSDSKRESIWDFIYSNYGFSPHSDAGERISFPEKYSRFDLSGWFGENFIEAYYDDLNKKSINVFKSITRPKNLMYALSWQHDGYSFDPYCKFETDEFDEWLVPVFPNGDLNFFLSEDFNSLLFSDGIEMAIYLSGESMITPFKRNNPIMFLINSHS
jgi:hypothetical protein